MPSRQERRQAERDAKRVSASGAAGGAGGAGAAGAAGAAAADAAAAALARLNVNPDGDWTTQAADPYALCRALGLTDRASGPKVVGILRQMADAPGFAREAQCGRQ